MKSLFAYYLIALILPLSLLFFIIASGDNLLFLISLMFYILIYRPLTDGFKLIRKKKITKKEIWKLVIGYGHVKWFKDLYLEK